MAKARLLYVDDEQENLDGFMFTFMRDYDIFTALSALQGLDLLKTHDIHVVISDQKMPGMSGVEFLAQVAVLYPDIVRIILTGYTDSEHLVQAINKGQVFQFITKPWSKSDLAPKLKNAVSTFEIKEENRKLIENLKIEKKRAEESDRLKTAFLNNISHEVRTPLNAIVGLSELLCMEELDDEDKRLYTQAIKRNADDLIATVSDIVDISKIDAGQLSMRKQEYDIHDLTEGIYSNFKDQYLPEFPHIEFVLSIPETSMAIRSVGDGLRVRQTIDQLLKNAFKFTDEGSISFGFEVVEDRDELFVEYFVKDTGIGIPANKHEAIFERFVKIEEDKSKLFRGNGVGLSIAKSLAEMQGGRIYLESQVGKGSTFYLRLPLLLE